jgi:hypothetical protein
VSTGLELVMRVIDPPPPTVSRIRPAATPRAARLECRGLLASTALVLFGLVLAYLGKVESLGGQSRPRDVREVINVRQLRTAADLLPLLDMFEDRFERRAVARALYTRATDPNRPLERVGGLAHVTLGADIVRGDRRYVQLRSRLARRPTLEAVPISPR